MYRQSTLALCSLSAVAWSIPAAAGQSTSDEFWPELGIYMQQGPLIWIEFVASLAVIQLRIPGGVISLSMSKPR